MGCHGIQVGQSVPDFDEFSLAEVLRTFQANIYLTRKPKEACAAKWKDDGDATLTPSAKMVGKVHEALRR